VRLRVKFGFKQNRESVTWSNGFSAARQKVGDVRAAPLKNK
jgi:hypothetical protein